MDIKSILKSVARIVFRVPINYTTVEVKELSPFEQLKGRNILITGGGRGLGYYMAKKCVLQGANVLIAGRNEETLRKTARELGERCSCLKLDVSKVSDLKDVFTNAAAIMKCSKIDSLISNAGISLHEGDFRSVTEENWDDQFNTNLKGNYFLVSEFIKYLETFDNKSGNIIVITSERSMRADNIPYGLTKTAINSFIKGIARKVIDEGIRINGVGPGVTTSDMTGFSREGNLYAGWQAGKRIFIPEEVAEVVNFLLSDVSACISGEIIICDQCRYIATW